MDTPILVLAGPTGVGKTALSFEIARRQNAEIISADSRQVFRTLDIGTAKPSREDLQGVPHHFINELDVGETWSAGQFADAANQRIDDMRRRGKRTLVVGGSTLYIEALVHGLAEIPRGDPAIRERLREEASTVEGVHGLFERLQEADPKGASMMDATKSQRIVRALEVFETTGTPWSSFFDRKTTSPYTFDVVVLTRPREELYERINQRVDAMLEAGLLDENKSLLDAGFRLDQNPLRTIGYQEPIAYLQSHLTHDEMVEALKRNTRRYAKRQLTWFRRRPEYRWIDCSEFTSVSDLADVVVGS